MTDRTFYRFIPDKFYDERRRRPISSLFTPKESDMGQLSLYVASHSLSAEYALRIWRECNNSAIGVSRASDMHFENQGVSVIAAPNEKCHPSLGSAHHVADYNPVPPDRWKKLGRIIAASVTCFMEESTEEAQSTMPHDEHQVLDNADSHSNVGPSPGPR